MANIHETEKRIGNFVKRTTGAALMVLGAGISMGSYADASRIDILNQANQQVHHLYDELQQKYGIHSSCTGIGGGSAGSVVCTTEIDGTHSKEEKDAILQEFEEKFQIGEKIIFESFDEKAMEEAQRRNTRDFLSFFAGLSMLCSGAAILDPSKKR